MKQFCPQIEYTSAYNDPPFTQEVHKRKEIWLFVRCYSEFHGKKPIIRQHNKKAQVYEGKQRRQNNSVQTMIMIINTSQRQYALTCQINPLLKCATNNVSQAGSCKTKHTVLHGTATTHGVARYSKNTHCSRLWIAERTHICRVTAKPLTAAACKLNTQTFRYLGSINLAR